MLNNTQRPFRITAPLIAGVLNDEDVRRLEPDELAPIDLIELRIDLCVSAMDEQSVAALAQEARSRFGKPILATIRYPSEGGQRDFGNRVALYAALSPHVEAVDIEISSAGELKQLRTVCTKTKTLLVGSYHNFLLTPDNDALEVIHTTGRALGADIVKLALMPQSREDIFRIVAFTMKHRTEKIITIGMGELGASTRLFTPLLGSLITYGTVARSTAPGQLSAEELSGLFQRLSIR
ncbi:MAG TPA: type I 3-dehydroquinate dehydratase [Dissulfurispiraceae bacterium]|nr:type I 3-dehydroquinate dehydratase [Dissulfurispiraceae bacterium]